MVWGHRLKGRERAANQGSRATLQAAARSPAQHRAEALCFVRSGFQPELPRAESFRLVTS
jgi:hypothetical protein